MKRKLIISAVLFTVLMSNIVYALDFSYSAAIENKGDKKYKAVRINSGVYNKVKENLADMVLYDSDNEPVPFFLNSFKVSGVEEKRTYAMKLVNSFIKDRDFYYDYGLETPQQEDVTATSVAVETGSSDFAKEVEIWGSYDSTNWEKVKEDVIYSVGGTRKLEVAFEGIKKYTFYRFRLSNNLEKVSFSSVELKFSKVQQNREYFTDTISPDFTVEERGNNTVIKVPALKNLKLSSIAIKTDSMFKREVSFEGAVSKMLYNLDFEDTKYRDLTIPLDQYRVTSDLAEIIIYNKDDKPIEIKGVEANYLVDELVFEGSKAGSYTLRFGNSEMLSPKSYDISNYREQIINEGYDMLSLQEIKQEQTTQVYQEPKKDYRMVFNITITAVALVMGVILFLKLKK
ncbi:MAG: hypothetical protein GX660_23265 [Clostridiaceae bacterium]|nr:hypothetical protein [Clostridiaceae bacterium]